MNVGVYIAIFLPLILLMLRQRQEREYVAQRIVKRKGEGTDMKELAERFVGKECLIYTLGGSSITGVIREVAGNAVLLESGSTLETVNLDYVMRIREYPRNKKGKKKSVVLD